ncbi:ABC transporter ATP-binding protein [Litorimonas sp. RW-G-Af-16]|uniref:ABC transporter ATP-binding protein n=1 Tax=Litorimonas sp. RW-G-Af-16 TaxID=3241168 RepID=UPI00390CCAE5
MLSIQNVHKRFGDVHAMNDVTLNLTPGLFGLLGPNGAGKSTLMRTLATLQSPDEGTITYNGEDIVKHPDTMRSTLGYLPQDFGVYPRMSAKALLDHIAILKGLNDKKEREAQIISLLENVNLLKHASASVSTYSGGMRQRFGVAQAMLGDPKILIVDEPTAGLDPFERQRFLDLLSEAGQEKIIILSTHIVEDVRDLCPDMAIMGEGKIVARGAPEALIDKIRHSVWRKKVEKDRVKDYKDNFPFLSNRHLMGGVIVSILSDSQPEAGFEQSEPTLEDAYFAHLYKLV